MDIHLSRFDRLMPQHSAMTIQSTPVCRSPIAALCLNTCGLTRLVFSVRQLSDATVTYLRTIRSTASRLRRSPRLLTNSGSSSSAARSASQVRSACTLSFLRGVDRSLRPLPEHRTWAPGPRTTSPPVRLISSDTRSSARQPAARSGHDVRTKSADRAPRQVLRFRRGSESQSSASHSAWMASRESSGNGAGVAVRMATYLKNERIADSRVLRLRALFARVVSTKLRNCPTSSASMSATCRRRCPCESTGGVPQQQPERIAIACHRMGAGLELADKAFGEEPLTVNAVDSVSSPFSCGEVPFGAAGELQEFRHGFRTNRCSWTHMPEIRAELVHRAIRVATCSIPIGSSSRPSCVSAHEGGDRSRAHPMLGVHEDRSDGRPARSCTDN